MAKLEEILKELGIDRESVVVVNREKVEASLRKLEKLQAKDPYWQEQKKEMERR